MYTKEELAKIVKEALEMNTDIMLTPFMMNPKKIDSTIVIGIMQGVGDQARLRYTVTVEDLSPEPIKS